jgi:hypothetical protein
MRFLVMIRNEDLFGSRQVQTGWVLNLTLSFAFIHIHRFIRPSTKLSTIHSSIQNSTVMDIYTELVFCKFLFLSPRAHQVLPPLQPLQTLQIKYSNQLATAHHEFPHHIPPPSRPPYTPHHNPRLCGTLWLLRYQQRPPARHPYR